MTDPIIRALRSYISKMSTDDLQLICFVQVCVGSGISPDNSDLTSEEFNHSQQLFGNLLNVLKGIPNQN